MHEYLWQGPQRLKASTVRNQHLWHLSAQRQSYLGETIGQTVQHERCPWFLRSQKTIQQAHLTSCWKQILRLVWTYFCKSWYIWQKRCHQLLARGPLEQHVAHSVHPLLRWNKHWCVPAIRENRVSDTDMFLKSVNSKCWNSQQNIKYQLHVAA